MPTTHENSALRGLLRLVSQHWSALGVSLHADRSSNLVIDPEALVWCTLEVGRHEPRLFDEVIDWLSVSHRRISVSRLKAVAGGPQDVRWSILSAVAERLSKCARAPAWRRLAQRRAEGDGHAPSPTSLFFDQDGQPLLAPTAPDPAFRDRGLLRGRFETRAQSSPPNLLRPDSLLLRAKAIFGSRASAYVWAALLTSEGLLQADLVQRTRYNDKNISGPLRDLVQAGICREERRRTAKWYALVNRHAWLDLLGLRGKPLRWPDWVRLFCGLVHLCRKWTWCNQQDLTEYLFASELRRAFVEAKDDIVASGLDVAAPTPDLFLVDELFARLETYLEELFDRALGVR